MAPIRRPVYRKAALEKRASPDPLDQLVSLTPLRAWIGLAALACLLIAAALWGFFGRLTVTVEQPGILSLTSQPEAVAYLSPSQAAAVRVGMSARVQPYDQDDSLAGTVIAVEPQAEPDGSPLMAVRVALESSAFADGTPCTVTIITREQRPISRVLPGIG